MTWLQAKQNPAAQRTSELDQEIGRLRAQIDRLNHELERNDPASIQSVLDEEKRAVKKRAPSQGIECGTGAEAGLELNTPAHYNELGVRKFDLAQDWARFKNWLAGGGSGDKKFETYFAAAHQEYLPPLRKETRIARNRFILFAIILLAFIWTVTSLLIPRL